MRVVLAPDGAGTKLVLDHDALAEDQAQHIEAGWPQMYWEPLRKCLGGKATLVSRTSSS